MKELLFILFIVGFINLSAASERDSLKAKADYRKDGLSLLVVLINDKGFLDEWQRPEMPQVIPIDTYKRGDEVIPIIIFSSDGKDENGNADLTYDIKIMKPDGTTYGDFKQLEVWKNAAAPVMHLVKQPIDIRLEENDPLGLYRIEATIHDNNKKVSVDFHLAFQVIE
jgi:hypothetical protein